MTNDARMDLLRDAVAEHGSQAKVGKRLGYSSATVSQVLSGNYGGQLDAFLTRVEEVFGKAEISCPVLGEILLPECVEERRKPFTTANPHRVRMFQACRVCPHNTDRKDE
jgi:transcriptional regulator with XRE-family HTH domain